MSENNEMAVIGRVAIVPKGEFDINASYKKLDMVLYPDDGNSYVAKKPVSGILPTDTEYWMKSTDMNKVNIATEQVAGIVKPDGDTITVDEDGTIHGSAKVDTATSEKAGIVKPDNDTITISGDTIKAIKAGFTGTKEEVEEAIQAGEIEEGEFVSITDDYEEGSGGGGNIIVDDELSEESENPVQNKVIAEKIAELNQAIEDAKALRASLEAYGMVKLSNSSAVTENVGLALPASEKNASIAGTLANQISIANSNIDKKVGIVTEMIGRYKYIDLGDLSDIELIIIRTTTAADDSTSMCLVTSYNHSHYFVCSIISGLPVVSLYQNSSIEIDTKRESVSKLSRIKLY